MGMCWQRNQWVCVGSGINGYVLVEESMGMRWQWNQWVCVGRESDGYVLVEESMGMQILYSKDIQY